MDDIVALTNIWLDVLPEGEFDRFPGEVSPDFVLRLPFVPPGVPNEIRGREAVLEALRTTGKARGRLTFTDKVIRRTDDPELMMSTCKGSAQVNNGKTYRNEYIMLTRIRDGVVIEHTEYLNPLRVIEAFAD
jgi:uncharacterized protein